MGQKLVGHFSAHWMFSTLLSFYKNKTLLSAIALKRQTSLSAFYLYGIDPTCKVYFFLPSLWGPHPSDKDNRP